MYVSVLWCFRKLKIHTSPTERIAILWRRRGDSFKTQKIKKINIRGLIEISRDLGRGGGGSLEKLSMREEHV